MQYVTGLVISVNPPQQKYFWTELSKYVGGECLRSVRSATTAVDVNSLAGPQSPSTDLTTYCAQTSFAPVGYLLGGEAGRWLVFSEGLENGVEDVEAGVESVEFCVEDVEDHVESVEDVENSVEETVENEISTLNAIYFPENTIKAYFD